MIRMAKLRRGKWLVKHQTKTPQGYIPNGSEVAVHLRSYCGNNSIVSSQKADGSIHAEALTVGGFNLNVRVWMSDCRKPTIKERLYIFKTIHHA